MDDKELVARIVEHLTRFVDERGPTTGASLGNELRLRFPEVNLGELGFSGLTQLLGHRAPLLAIVDRSGSDLVWSTEVQEDLPAVDLPTEILDDLLIARDPPRPTSPVRLEQAIFHHYRSLADVKLEISPLTVLVGSNGAGKSNLLDGLFRTLRLTEFHPEIVLKDVGRLITRGTKPPVKGEVVGAERYRLRWEAGERTTVRVARNSPPRLVHDARGTPAARALGSARFLKLDAERVASPSFSVHEAPYVDHRGRNVAAVLAALAAGDPERFERIQEKVREVLPKVSRLRMPRTTVAVRTTEVTYTADGRPIERLVPREQLGNALEAQIAGSWIPGPDLSEGTLLVIALQTILHGHRVPRVLLLDDLDRGLHPKAQRILLRQLGEATRDPSLTVVATTHSPFVLDEVDPEAVRVVLQDDRGHTRVEPLTGSPKWASWKETMTAGEFWVYAGEDWLDAP